MQSRMGRQIQRPRPCLSCSTCRRRKVRCGRESPECYNCVRLKESCHYETFRPRRSQGQGQPSSTRDARDREDPVASEKKVHEGQGNIQRTSIVQDDRWNEWPRNQFGTEKSQAEGLEVSSKHTTTRDLKGTLSVETMLKKQNDLDTPQKRPSSSTLIPGTMPIPPSTHWTTWSTATFIGPSGEKASINKSRGASQDLIRSLEDAENANFHRKRRRQSPTPPMNENEIDLSGVNILSPLNFQTSFSKPPNLPFTDKMAYYRGFPAQQDRTRAQFVESTFWALIRGHEPLCKDLLERQGHNSSFNFLEMVKLLKLLPRRATCDALLISFVIAVFPILPLLHVPTFREDYAQIWDWLSKNDLSKISSPKPIRDPTFLPLLFAVLFCGAAAAPAALWNQSSTQAFDRETLVSDLESACYTSLKLCQYDQYPTLNCLMASLLRHGCCKDHGKRLETSFTREAIRAAQSLGLHVESKAGASDGMRDVRRRIWAHVMWLEVQDSIMNGSQIVPDSADFDGETSTSFCSFTYITPPAQTDDGRMPTVAYYIRGLYETTLFERSLILALQSRRGPHHVDLRSFLGELQTLHSTLDLLISKIPANGIPEKGYIPARLANASPLTDKELYHDSDVAPTVFGSWARIKLTMLKLKAAILFHKATLGDAVLETRQGKKTWQSVVQLCASYLENFLRLTRVPAFSPYHWSLSTNDEPLQPMLIILVYLQHDPSSSTALEIRYFIDEVLEFYTGLEARPSWKHGQHNLAERNEGLSTSWEFIKDLRAKLDTNITRYEQDDSQLERFTRDSGQISPPQSTSSFWHSDDGFNELEEPFAHANSGSNELDWWEDTAFWGNSFSAKKDTGKADLPMDQWQWEDSRKSQNSAYCKGRASQPRDTKDGSAEPNTKQPNDLHNGTSTNATVHEDSGEAFSQDHHYERQNENGIEPHVNQSGESDFLSAWIASGGLGFEGLLDSV